MRIRFPHRLQLLIQLSPTIQGVIHRLNRRVGWPVGLSVSGRSRANGHISPRKSLEESLRGLLPERESRPTIRLWPADRRCVLSMSLAWRLARSMKTIPKRDAIRGIVFDAVGTLIEPRPTVAQVYASAAQRQGVELDTDEVRGRFRKHFAALESGDASNPFVTDEANERRRWQEIVALCLPEIADPDLAFLELWDHFASRHSWEVFPDALPAAEQLKNAGFRLGIASNFDSRLHRILEGHESLRTGFWPAVVSSEVGYRKPHSGFYRAVCERIELDPEEILFVGDDLENDYHGPIRAGLRAVLLNRKAPHDLGVSNVTSLSELVEEILGPSRRNGNFPGTGSR